MATVNSNSTVDELIAEYADTAGYREANSANLAWRHATVCRILAMKRPEQSAHGAASFKFLPPAVYLDEARLAEGWAQQRAATNADVVHYGLEDFRR